MYGILGSNGLSKVLFLGMGHWSCGVYIPWIAILRRSGHCMGTGHVINVWNSLQNVVMVIILDGFENN